MHQNISGITKVPIRLAGIIDLEDYAEGVIRLDSKYQRMNWGFAFATVLAVAAIVLLCVAVADEVPLVGVLDDLAIPPILTYITYYFNEFARVFQEFFNVVQPLEGCFQH